MAVVWKRVLKEGDSISSLNNDSSYSTTTGTVTTVSVGTGLNVSNATTTPSISVDLDEFADMTGNIDSADEVILLDDGLMRKKAFSELKLGQFDNDQNWTANTGDITGVDLTGGTGISIASETNTTSGSYSSTINCNLEGTELISTGETGGTKFLREDGDGTCSWQTASASDVDVSNANLLTRLGNLESAGGGTDQSIPIGYDAGDTLAFRGHMSIDGNLTVKGATTTLNTTELHVEDKRVMLANHSSPTKDTGTDSGIQVETSATEADFPEVKWTKDLGGGNTDGTGTANGLTGWSVSNMHTSNQDDIPIAVMDFKAGAFSTERSGGVGSLGYDTTNENLYIRINDDGNP